MSLYTALTQVLAPYAAKLNGLLTGWDGTKYTTPGEAVRRQFTDLHVMIGDVPGEAIAGSAVSYDGTSSDLSATNMQAAVDETNEKIATVNGRLQQQAAIEKGRLKGVTDGYDINGGVVTDLYVYAGETVSIDVEEISGQANVFIQGYTQSDILSITSTGHKERAFTHDGYITVYCTSGSSVNAHMTLKNTLSDDVKKNSEGLTAVESSMNKTITPALEIGTINTTSGGNYASENALRTPSYINGAAVKASFSNCKLRAFAYDSNGTYVGAYSETEGWSKNWRTITALDSPVYLKSINEDGYQLRLEFGTFTGEVSAENADVKIEISRIDNLEADKDEVYTVGASGDFQTFTAMLTGLEGNTHKKTVYISPGTYDIFTEMGGADWMLEVDTTLTWRDVCHVVPPNTEIIGLGDVILTWNPTDEQIIDQAHAFMFAPLNLSGSCKIKNIKIHCSNCRYGIHDETSGRAEFNGIVHEFENVEVIYTASTYGVKYAYGAGHNKNCKYRFKNCLFAAAYASVWSIHDWPATAEESSQFEFDNCLFKDSRNGNPANIRFSSSDQNGRLDDVKINGCFFNSVTFTTEGSADVKQGYKVTTMLCKAYVPGYSTHILEADRIAPEDYLVIA